MPAYEDLPDWERLLSAERHLQRLVPGAVLVGGSAAAVHARHRVSMDGDHVLADLRDRFDEILAALEAAAGWQTERVQRPVLILGQLDGVLTGIRQLRRTRPLETEEVEGLRVPTGLGAGHGATGAGGAALSVSTATIESSRAMWNRSALDLDSDEVLAQILDRGELAAWRALYGLARTDARLRAHQVDRVQSAAAVAAFLAGGPGLARGPG